MSAQQVRDEVQSMEERYFGAAQRVVDRMIATGVRDGKFDLTQQEFIARFAPELKALSGVRDRLFALTRQAMQADQAARLQRLAATTAAGGLVLLAMLAALLMLHRWIIRPMAELAAMLIRLAHGDRSVRLTARHGSHEVAELASAIEVLRVATIEADAAAARRRVELKRWTAQLGRVLDTIDLIQARAATITDVLPALLEQLSDAGAATTTRQCPGWRRRSPPRAPASPCCEAPPDSSTPRCGKCTRWATARTSASTSWLPRWTRWRAW